MPRISFPSRGIAGRCADGETILEAVRNLGYVIDHACGGNARCGTCCVKVVAGADALSAMEPEEESALRELGLEAPFRLSCQARIHGDVIVLPGI